MTAKDNRFFGGPTLHVPLYRGSHVYHEPTTCHCPEPQGIYLPRLSYLLTYLSLTVGFNFQNNVKVCCLLNKWWCHLFRNRITFGNRISKTNILYAHSVIELTSKQPLTIAHQSNCIIIFFIQGRNIPTIPINIHCHVISFHPPNICQKSSWDSRKSNNNAPDVISFIAIHGRPCAHLFIVITTKHDYCDLFVHCRNHG